MQAGKGGQPAKVLTRKQYDELCELAGACHAAERGDYKPYEAFVRYAAAITVWDENRDPGEHGDREWDQHVAGEMRRAMEDPA